MTATPISFNVRTEKVAQNNQNDDESSNKIEMCEIPYQRSTEL